MFFHTCCLVFPTSARERTMFCTLSVLHTLTQKCEDILEQIHLMFSDRSASGMVMLKSKELLNTINCWYWSVTLALVCDPCTDLLPPLHMVCAAAKQAWEVQKHTRQRASGKPIDQLALST